MRTGRPRTTLMLTAEERQRLDSLAHRSRSAAHMARRARIILACADGGETTVIARRLHVSPTTVCKWRTRFLRDRLDGLFDEPRPGAPRQIMDDQVETIVIRTLKRRRRGRPTGVCATWRRPAGSLLPASIGQARLADLARR